MNNHSVTRSNANKSVVSAQDFPKSGFDLTYKSFQDYILGRLHVSGYQHLMPADKFSGHNGGNFFFNRIVTPVMSDVVVSQQNFYLPYRAIDRTFEENFAPNKNNNMSADWRTPTLSLTNLVRTFYDAMPVNLQGALDSLVSADDITYVRQASESVRNYFNLWISPRNRSNLYLAFANLYLADFLNDFSQRMEAILTDDVIASAQTAQELRLLVFDAVFTPFFGESSLLDCLGYNYLRRSDLIELASTSAYRDFSDLIGSLDEIPMCEYALRIYYAIWYEHYRDINLEPVSSTLPKWKDFGSTSIFDDISGIPFLVARIRSWSPDVFVSSLPDDICRHVYAPIFTPEQDGTLSGSVQVLQSDNDYNNAENTYADYYGGSVRNVRSAVLSFRDVTTGGLSSLNCPIPASVNDSIADYLGGYAELNPLGLDLLNLRRAQMLERYLKRNFYFGDEYQDRMLGHYGSRVSDMRINRPELLSSSINSISVSQEVASVGTEQTPVGSRSASASATSNGDGFSFFAEEFGMVINIISFMPKAQYAGVCPQNLLYRQIDFPVPEFANQNEEFGRVMEIASSGILKNGEQLQLFGHYPYAHAYRSRVDEVHGTYLSDRQNYTFRRYFDMNNADSTPKLNYQFIHCVPNLGMFADQIRLDGQVYGFVNHDFFVERVLPTPVEQI